MPLPPTNYERIKVQPIDLTESLKLQKEHSEKLKALQQKQAVLRLSAANTPQVPDPQVNLEETTTYREVRDDTDEEETEEPQDEPDSDDSE